MKTPSKLQCSSVKCGALLEEVKDPFGKVECTACGMRGSLNALRKANSIQEIFDVETGGVLLLLFPQLMTVCTEGNL